MVEPTSNDNEFRAVADARPPDAFGQAALLLVESLIHFMVARSLLSVGEAVEIVGIAAEVKTEVGRDLGDSTETMNRSLALLASIGASLATDIAK